MQEVIKFLHDSQVFYLATVEGGQPCLRPLGFVMEYQGKLCFGTNNKKDMFKQMQANPYIAICATVGTNFLRINGTFAGVPDREAKEKALAELPFLQTMYAADDGIFEIFTIENADASFCDMKGGKRTVRL